MTFKYLADPQADSSDDYRELARKFEVYMRYLNSVKDAFPPSAFAFATASWHYRTEDPRSLHDSWVESVTIAELHPADDLKERHMTVEVTLLGAYHDGYMHIKYLNVNAYQLAMSGTSKWPTGPSIHGDWLDDEVRLSDANQVLHEVVFAPGGRWLIECADIEWRWEAIA